MTIRVPLSKAGVIPAKILIVACILFCRTPFLKADTSSENMVYDEFISEATYRIKESPLDPDAYNERGYLYLLKQDYSEAIADFTRSIDIAPGHAGSYYNRGLVYQKHLHDNKKALADFDSAVKRDPLLVEAYLEMGKIYAQLRQYHAAIDCYGRYIHYGPEDPEAHYNRAIAYYFTREYSKAWDDIHKTEELGGTIYEAFVRKLRRASGRDK